MEGSRAIRFMLVCSALSPVFLLWAIRGVQGVAPSLVAGICLMIFFLPNAAVKLIFWRAKRSRNIKVITPSRISSHQDQVLTYLFAMLLPLIEVSFNGVSDAIAAACAMLFTLFLFYKMHLHYINLFLLFAGYQIFEIAIDVPGTPLSASSFVVVSKRRALKSGHPISGYRIGGNVLVDIFHDRSKVST